IAIVVDGEQVNTISEGQSGTIVLDKTPFYAESGGQLGDTGKIVTEESEALVTDTKKFNKIIHLHEVTIKEGSISVGDKVTATVNSDQRKNTAKNHTSTHLLHKVLKEMLGEHVNQAGSMVAHDRLRFDYTHFEAVTPE